MIRRGPLIAALVGAGLILLMVVALILPRAAAVHSTQKQVAQARAEQQNLQLQLTSLRDDRSQAAKNRKRLRALEAKIPTMADLPGLIRLLNAAATESAVSFMSLNPGQPTLSGQVSTIPAQLAVTGGFFAIDEFLYRIETLPRTARILALTVSKGGDGNLSATVVAEFFTTDASAGPGSQPGPSETTGGTPASPTPNPGAAS